MGTTTTRLRRFWFAAAAALLLASCGGGDDGPRYGKLVVFGDSLSDVGSYRTPGVDAIGGGKYTVNGPSARIWVEQIAAAVVVRQPCPARIGLESSGPLVDFAAPITDVPGCFDYAQGGARVTDPIGPWNKALLPGDSTGFLGQLTEPVVTQMQRHLAAAGGAFAGDDLVLVRAGANDAFMNLGQLAATIAAGGDPTAAATAAVTAMGVAGGELAAYVNSLVVANGATRVVVVSLPDISITPSALAQDAQTRALMVQMVQTFNAQLSAGLAGVDQVLLVDWFADSQRIVADPAASGLTNITDPACDLTLATLRSLSCSAETLVPGDVSRYYFADDVHPTPYGYRLLAQLVAGAMLNRGWL